MRPGHSPPNPPPSPALGSDIPEAEARLQLAIESKINAVLKEMAPIKSLGSDIRTVEARFQLAIESKINAVLLEMVQMDRNNLAANALKAAAMEAELNSMRSKVSLS